MLFLAGHIGALAGRGSALLGLNRPGAALLDFASVLQTGAVLATPLYGVAESHRRLGHRDQAVRFYQRYSESQAPDATPALKREALLWIRSLRKSAD